MKRLLLLLCILGFSGLLPASDMAREQRLVEQIEDAILVGDPQWLEAGGVRFFGILTEAEAEPVKGAVLLLHGMGAHPDWPEIINPLRSALPEAGWETLSIQLPVAPAGSGFRAYLAMLPESRERIDAALALLRSRSTGPVFMIGHSLGATMGTDYLAHRDAGAVAGFISIGLSANPERPKSGSLANIAKIHVPMLDLYGSLDFDGIKGSAAARARAAQRAGNSDYGQRQVDGADHFFHDRDQVLIDIVEAWLGSRTVE